MSSTGTPHSRRIEWRCLLGGSDSAVWVCFQIERLCVGVSCEVVWGAQTIDIGLYRLTKLCCGEMCRNGEINKPLLTHILIAIIFDRVGQGRFCLHLLLEQCGLCFVILGYPKMPMSTRIAWPVTDAPSKRISANRFHMFIFLFWSNAKRQSYSK